MGGLDGVIVEVDLGRAGALYRNIRSHFSFNECEVVGGGNRQAQLRASDKRTLGSRRSKERSACGPDLTSRVISDNRGEGQRAEHSPQLSILEDRESCQKTVFPDGIFSTGVSSRGRFHSRVTAVCRRSGRSGTSPFTTSSTWPRWAAAGRAGRISTMRRAPATSGGCEVGMRGRGRANSKS